MKNKYRIAAVSSFLLLLVFIAVAIFVYASHDDSELNEQTVYTCPMHPEVISDKPGDCPDCGMDLVETNTAEVKQYICPMCPEVISDKPGDCPGCGMPLVEKPGIAEGKQYTCPMHPEVVSDKHGDCPDCGMPLVEKAGHSEMNHQAISETVVRKAKKAKRNKSSEAGKQFVCSMHPQVIRNEPGDCPICGMFLIVLVDQDMNRYDSSISDVVRSVNESVLASVKSIRPERSGHPLIIEATGVVTFDPRHVRTVSARFGGLVEKSFVRQQFQYVKKGQKICEIYNPYIYLERWNYVLLIQKYPDRDDLTAEALEWFNLLGLSKGQVDSLKKATKPDYYLPVYSWAEGYAVSNNFDPENFSIYDGTEKGTIGLRDGITVETGDPLFKLIDVKALRIDLKIKTEFVSLLKKGHNVTITDALNPDIRFNTSIDRMEPLNGGLFQSARIYIRDNERHLVPGRQINASILAGDRQGLWVPESAVADLGKRKSVFVRKDEKFIATEVKTGIKSGGKIEIISGLDENSIIAEKALLLVDSDGFFSLNK